MSKMSGDMSGEVGETCRQMREQKKSLAECFGRETELKCVLAKLEKQLEEASRARADKAEPLACEAELRVEKKHLCCLRKKAALERRRHPEAWKTTENIEKLCKDNCRMKLEICQLRHDHELVRCRGTVCYDYEDAMISVSLFMRNNVHQMKKKTISSAEITKLAKHAREKIVSMLLLSELVYLYKQFRPHPEILIPVEVRRSPLEKMILSEFSHARSRVKVLTERYRSSAKELRAAEEAVKHLARPSKCDPAKPKVVKKDPCGDSQAPDAHSEPQEEERAPLTPPQILELVEEASEPPVPPVVVQPPVCPLKEFPKVGILAYGIAPKVKPRAVRQTCPETREPQLTAPTKQFRRPVKQVKQKRRPEEVDVFDVEETVVKCCAPKC